MANDVTYSRSLRGAMEFAGSSDDCFAGYLQEDSDLEFSDYSEEPRYLVYPCKITGNLYIIIRTLLFQIMRTLSSRCFELP